MFFRQTSEDFWRPLGTTCKFDNNFIHWILLHRDQHHRNLELKLKDITQLAFTYSKLLIETPEQDVKFVQNQQLNDTNGAVAPF